MESLEKELVTKKELSEVCALFKEVEGIEDIEVYGSLARQGHGNDIDIILISTPEKERHFYNRMPEIINSESPHEETYKLADELFENGSDILKKAEIIAGSKIDILVHAKDWRDRVDEIQSESYHSDPNFMQNISDKAISLSDIELE